MKKSIITKKFIGKALKTLMMKEDFEHISVVDIMNVAQIRRQTFYNYFLDKYELVTWIFEDELNEIIQDNLDFLSWQKSIHSLLSYLEHNRNFYKKAFAFSGQNAFEFYFLQQCKILIEKATSDIEEQEKITLQAHDKNFFIHYNACALHFFIKEKLEEKENLTNFHPKICAMLVTQIRGYRQ